MWNYLISPQAFSPQYILATKKWALKFSAFATFFPDN